jgi:aspartyl-tRNA(Asn)/glutamyl-tRNA(Gln) amidotransferase subunit A
VDLIAMPTSPTPAFRLGERTADPIKMYLADVFTVGANLAGLPAITVPCGLAEGRLPVGLQLTARLMEEAVMFRAADAFERATGFAQMKPPVSCAG